MTDTTEALPPLPKEFGRVLSHTAAYSTGGYCAEVQVEHMSHLHGRVFTDAQMKDYARAALAQRQQVPENATEPMQKAMQRAVLMRKSMNDVWRAALSELPAALTAAPSAQAEPALRDKIGDLLAIGSAARTDGVILTNLGNLQRRAACLSAVEREFFTREVPGEDEDEPGEECDLNWGAEPGEYVEQFRAVLAAPPAAQAEPQVPLDIATLRAEVEGLRADAERYRFLRNECSGEPRFGEVAPTIVLFGLQGKAEDVWCDMAISTNHLTDTIDAAIVAAKADKEGA